VRAACTPLEARPAIQAELRRIEEDCFHSWKAHFNWTHRWAPPRSSAATDTDRDHANDRTQVPFA
jgi:hypothetical protein